MRPRLLSWRSSSSLSEPPLLHLLVDPGDPHQDDQVEDPYQVEEPPGDRGADDVGGPMEAQGVVGHLGVERPDPEVQEDGQQEHDGGVAERVEVPHTQRPLAVVDKLTGRVVDGGDVVGVEGVAHSQGVGEDAGPESQEPGLGDVVVVARGGRHQAPTDHVEADDGERHPADDPPFRPAQPSRSWPTGSGRSCRTRRRRPPGAPRTRSRVRPYGKCDDHATAAGVVRPMAGRAGSLADVIGTGGERLADFSSVDSVIDTPARGSGSRPHGGSCWRSCSRRTAT